VEVDAAWQPVDAGGAVVYENLWAAGSALAHADGIAERSLEGVAVATGTAVGIEVARQEERSLRV
jgi:glycerol-3-phosphate dehydrogenase subunit B